MTLEQSVFAVASTLLIVAILVAVVMALYEIYHMFWGDPSEAGALGLTAIVLGGLGLAVFTVWGLSNL